MRKRIYEIIEVNDSGDVLSRIYDVVMIIVIILSLLPIALKSYAGVIGTIDKVTSSIFVVDYILRLITADYKLNKKIKSFFIYPFTPMAIIDFLSILPSITPTNGAFRLLKVIRLLRSIRVFRAFKIFRYSKSISIIINVFINQKEFLLAVGGLAVGYIVISALVVMSIEPETFPTFFDAVYWATISLTTVGYGDIYAVSSAGRIVTMISSIFGIAIVALPAGIITAGYMEEINRQKSSKEAEKEEDQKRV